MTSQKQRTSRSKPRQWVVAAILLPASIFFSCGVAEIVLRARGDQPFDPGDIDIRVDPGGKYQSGDPILGYRHLPGEYQITFPNGDSWKATHLPDTLRITRPLESYDTDRVGPEVWVLGCSFVHGWGLDDADTFPWKLQERLPDYTVRNFGVGGYSTLQSLLQFREALERGPKPAVAALAYADFHDRRNTRLRVWKKATFGYVKFGTTAQPYVRLTRAGDLELSFDDGEYRDLFLSRHFALAARLDAAYARIEDRFYHSHQVSRRLVMEFAQTAREHGVPFIVAGLRGNRPTSSMLSYARKNGILAVDISVSLQEPGMTIAFDQHPSARGTARYAEKLARFMRKSDLLTTEADIRRPEDSVL